MNRSTAFAAALLAVVTATAQPQAAFDAAEAQLTYYEMGWDSAEEAQTWTYKRTASGNFSWHLYEYPIYTGQPLFSSIDPESTTSLRVCYSNSATQDEVATSPAISILAGSEVEFYACFRSVFLIYAPWYFQIIEQPSGKVLYTLNAFTWSQQNAFTGPSWQKFNVDLTPYADKKVAFAFRYTGPGGEDLGIDGFRVKQNAMAAGASISIEEGQAVHFIDRSEGAPTAWHWLFLGGTPAESHEQHPTVSYDTAGIYDVTLTVTNDKGQSTVTRPAYINVKPSAPTALIGLPTTGYLSPWVATFVPTGVPVEYRDLSTGHPTEWHWTFEGATPAESSEQHPTVTYEQEGRYGLTLDVSNAAGTSSDFMKDAIQAGGSQYVWNIATDEYKLFGELELGQFGFYGGTNWLGIERFGERLAAPQVPATIDRVQVWFYSVSVATPDAPITADIRSVGADGLPADVLASATITAADIAYDDKELVPTDFVFAQPITLSEPFFVTVGPFPNGFDEASGDEDAISIMCVRRESSSLSTVYHYMEDEDEQGRRLGTFRWWANADEPVSFCITPQLTFTTTSGIGTIATDTHEPLTETRFDLQGRRIASPRRGLAIIRTPSGRVEKRLMR